MQHIVYVHSTMHHYSKDYLQKLRRNNYVTPKHYLDYINTYLRLLGKDNDNNKQVYGLRLTIIFFIF